MKISFLESVALTGNHHCSHHLGCTQSLLFEFLQQARPWLRCSHEDEIEVIRKRLKPWQVWEVYSVEHSLQLDLIEFDFAALS